MTDQSQADAANLGAARPPVIYGAAIAIGLGLQFAWPIGFLPQRIAALPGILLIVAAGILFFYSVAQFRAAGTPVPGNRPTTAIVRSGAYRFSRNPIYVAFCLFQLGIAVWANSLWLIATLVAAIALMAAVVIPREERYLEGKFGSEYLDYKARVRRWI